MTPFPSALYCPNLDCRANKKRLKTAQYKSKKMGIYYCRLCKTSWNATLGTFLYNIKTPIPVILKSLHKVTSGKSLRQVAKEERVSIDSIYYWMKRAKKFPNDISKLLQKYLNLNTDEIQGLLNSLEREGLRKRSKNLS